MSNHWKRVVSLSPSITHFDLFWCVCFSDSLVCARQIPILLNFQKKGSTAWLGVKDHWVLFDTFIVGSCFQTKLIKIDMLLEIRNCKLIAQKWTYFLYRGSVYEVYQSSWLELCSIRWEKFSASLQIQIMCLQLSSKLRVKELIQFSFPLIADTLRLLRFFFNDWFHISCWLYILSFQTKIIFYLITNRLDMLPIS